MTDATPFRFEDTYARAVPALSLPWEAATAPDPVVRLLNADVAGELGVDPEALREPEGARLLTGTVPDGVTTYAQAYSGHQFGMYSPRLGDGRAVLLGEVIDAAGRRRDLHLKGSGRTPFARGGDGKAVLGPMLREYVMGEAMHALGIPTTRALAVTTTGEQVFRDGRMLPGAVLARVASSHLRVGTFQFAAATGGPPLVRDLADHAIARHHPGAADASNPYLDLFARVVRAQAELVARWMLVGFVHGVMNTDNMTISGETIDYGPCAFVDAADPAAVFSSIDHGGRYAYGQQPAVAQWNLARLAETLLPLVDTDEQAAVEAATGVLTAFAPAYDEAVSRGMAAKLGVAPGESTRALVTDLLPLLAEGRVDHTGFFRALAAGDARTLFPAGLTDRFDAWAARREALLRGGGTDGESVAAAMNRVNPVYIPRNHRVEEALEAAVGGDLDPVQRLVDAVSHPFDERPEYADLAGPAPADAMPHVTYCGT
ncbi:protein adenylyltransferase SelO [Agilicoccus flavus]|uniref:protein adenylyltransferase SelO n=1 Tax=Agilicoccus flavus TaxID=2775968 RepID=UPI001CF70E1B|nr:YdiU family protein [Agilicoccus flavus]